MGTMLEKINKSKDNMTSLVTNTNNKDATSNYVTLLRAVEDLIIAI
jgi:hypothetical protein